MSLKDLEFLGDRVLGLAISSIIYKKFTKNNEGDLSKKLSYLSPKKFFTQNIYATLKSLVF